MCQFILNQHYVFREHQVLESLSQISQAAGDKFVGNFVKSLFNKVKEVAQIPPTYNREEALHQNSQTITNKIKLSIKVALSQKKVDLTNEEFIFLVKLISHPLVSPTNRALLILIKSLEDLFPQGKLASNFEAVADPLIDYAFRSRSGILSPNPTLRAMAINIGVALST